MKLSSRILATIFVLGLVYAFFRLFSGIGGSGLGDFIDVLGYTSLVLFFTSFLILAFNDRQLERHFVTFFFLLLGFPMTIIATKQIVRNINYNRTPDLTANYPRPIDDEQFIGDSIHIKITIDSLVALRNRQTKGTKVLYAFIDTIIYSQKGDQVFIIYVKI